MRDLIAIWDRRDPNYGRGVTSELADSRFPSRTPLEDPRSSNPPNASPFENHPLISQIPLITLFPYTVYQSFPTNYPSPKPHHIDLYPLKMHIIRKHPTVNITAAPHPQDPDDPPVLSSDPRSDTSTSNSDRNLHSYLTSFQASLSVPEEPSPSTSVSEPLSDKVTKPQQSHITSFLPKKINHAQKKKIDNVLMKLFTLDFQPFSVVEDRGFRDFVRALNPSYELPNRKLISSSFLPAAYEQCFTRVQEKLSCVESVCLTTNTWTSKTMIRIWLLLHIT